MAGTRASGLSHAALDINRRRAKAEKISRLLALHERAGSQRMLEVGTGSGGIANYFGADPSRRFIVDAVDVIDSRQVFEGYRYARVEGVQLPFPDASFDIVISNHVIEHVGDRAAQLEHLRELARVLADDGVGYLAVPNRWMLVEPHYRVAFLSWWPRSWRSPYLRLVGADRGSGYDCEPLRLPELERLLAEAGLAFENQCVAAVRETLAIEQPRGMIARGLRRVPDRWLHRIRWLIPTLIYRIHPARPGKPGLMATTR